MLDPRTRSAKWLRGSVLAFALCAAPALAQDAAGAKQLQDSLAPYIGQQAFERGIVTVSPDGAVYKIDIDLEKAFAGIAKTSDASLKAGHWTFAVAPLSGNTWSVKSNGFPPIALSWKKGDQDEDFSVTANGYVFDGIYDTKLSAFLSATNSLESTTFASHGRDGDMEAEYGSATFSLKGKPEADGSVSTEIHQEMSSLTEKVTIKENGPVTATIKTGLIVFDASVDKMKADPVRDILAFFIKNFEKQRIIAAQADLRTRLLATLPIWSSWKGAYKFNDVSVDTPIGVFKMDAYEHSINLGGFVKDAKVAMGIKMSGLSVPTGVIPAWTTSLIPSDFSIDAEFSGVNGDALARLVIENFDLGKDPPLSESAQAQLLAAFLAGRPKITLQQSTIKSSAIEIEASGEVGDLAMAPKGKFTLDASGLDEAIVALGLAVAENPDVVKAAAALAAAKAMATDVEGKSRWVIEFSSLGTLLINGKDIKKLLGQ